MRCVSGMLEGNVTKGLCGRQENYITAEVFRLMVRMKKNERAGRRVTIHLTVLGKLKNRERPEMYKNR